MSMLTHPPPASSHLGFNLNLPVAFVRQRCQLQLATDDVPQKHVGYSISLRMRGLPRFSHLSTPSPLSLSRSQPPGPASEPAG